MHIDLDVASMHGVQGESFFRAIAEHAEELWSIVNVFCGYVWAEHVPLYEQIGINVKVLRENVIEGEPVKYIWVTR